MGRWGKWNLFSLLANKPKDDDEEITKEWSPMRVTAIRYTGQLVDVYTNMGIVRDVPPAVIRELFGDQGIYILARANRTTTGEGFPLTCRERAVILCNSSAVVPN